MPERLYGRLCLTCGFVVHGLFARRPFPIVRRCGLCRDFPPVPDDQKETT